MIYRAYILERWLVPVTVEADSPEQARQLISEGQGDYGDRIPEDDALILVRLREAGSNE